MSLFGFEDDLDVETTDIVPVTDDGERCPEASTARQSSLEKSKLTVSQIQKLLVNDLLDEYANDDTLQDTENTSSIFEETVSTSTPQPRRAVLEALRDETKSAFTASENVTSRMEVSGSHILDDNFISVIDDPITKTNKVVPLRSKSTRAVAREKYENIENERSSLSTNNVIQSVYVPKTNITQTKSKHLARKNCENARNNKSVSFLNDVTQSELQLEHTIDQHVKKKILQCIENMMNEDSIDTTELPKRKNAKKIPKKKLVQNEIVEKKAEEINSQFKLVEEYQLLVE